MLYTRVYSGSVILLTAAVICGLLSLCILWNNEQMYALTYGWDVPINSIYWESGSY